MKKHKLLIFLLFSSFAVFAQNSEIKSAVLPSASQQQWMDLGFGMFIHFGINTYYDKEWSDGTLAVKGFNPVTIDTDQWC
ncbi:crotonobetainyl-CoA--carnitine CoA-transferase, partial [bacterium]|nr:crotonobetainyl-CoA--carnitine CoA-transferase [bacterium]